MVLAEDPTTQTLRLGLVIVDLPQFTISEVRHRTGTNESTIRGFLRDLRLLGGLEELDSLPATGRGRPRKRYRLTSAGVSHLQRRNADLATAAVREESVAAVPMADKQSTGAAGRKQPSHPLSDWLKEVLAKKALGLQLTSGLPPLIATGEQLIAIQGEAELSESLIGGLAAALMTPLQVEHFRQASELELAFSLEQTRFLAHLSSPVGGLAMRLEPVAAEMPTFSQRTALAIEDLCSKESGLVLVGDLGPGLADIVAGVVNLLNETRFESIVTIEGPAVYLHRRKKALVSQFEVGVTAATATYFKALQVALRQNPSVVVIDDLTDPDTLSAATRLALDGRLVIGVVSAPEMTRGLQMLVQGAHNPDLFRDSLANCLLGVVWQSSRSRMPSSRRLLEADVFVANDVSPWLRESGRFQEAEKTTSIAGSPVYAHAIRDDLSEAQIEVPSGLAPNVITMKVPVDRIRDILVGDKLLSLERRTGCRIQVEGDGRILIASPDEDSASKAVAIIEELTAAAELNKTYLGKVVRVVAFGAFVEILPGVEGLLHISEMAHHRIQDIHQEVNEGDQILVKVVNIDPSGKIRLSRKALLDQESAEFGAAAAVEPLAAAGESPHERGADDPRAEHPRRMNRDRRGHGAAE
jgi:Tfp pilus assembly pilus retraction ATPase PilT/DNA-binding PadR family transcriptional regulator